MFHSNLIGDIPIFVGYHVRWWILNFCRGKTPPFSRIPQAARCTASTVPTTRTALAARGSYWPRASGCSRNTRPWFRRWRCEVGVGWTMLNQQDWYHWLPWLSTHSQWWVGDGDPLLWWRIHKISKVIFDDFWWSTWINLPIFDAQLKGPISSRWSLHFCRASPRFSTGGIYMFLGEIAYFFIFWLNLQCFMVKSQFFGCLNQCLCISCRLNQSFRRFNLFHSNCLRFRFEFLQVTSPFLMILSPFFPTSSH